MHANWSWSQVLHISYLGIDTATQRRVLQLYIVMPSPFVGCILCPICVPIEIVVLISGPKQSGPEIWEKRLVNNIQQFITGRQWDNTCSSTAVLSVVSEWVIGHWLWMHVMNCAHGFRLWTHKLCPLVIHFAGKTWQGYQRSIRQYMMLSWRESLLYNGVIRSSHWWHLTRAKSNDMYTFSNRPPVDLKKGSSKLGSAKAITKLFMSLQARHDADIDEFCKHENQREHPSLSDRGKLRQDTKSGIIGCLPGIPAPGHSPLVRNATVVLDMAAVIHIIKPQRASILGEYTHMQLMPCSQSQMTENTSRVDAVKTQVSSHKTRAKRGETTSRRTRVSTKIPIPKGLQKFIKDCHNKVISVH